MCCFFPLSPCRCTCEVRHAALGVFRGTSNSDLSHFDSVGSRYLESQKLEKKHFVLFCFVFCLTFLDRRSAASSSDSWVRGRTFGLQLLGKMPRRGCRHYLSRGMPAGLLVGMLCRLFQSNQTIRKDELIKLFG